MIDKQKIIIYYKLKGSMRNRSITIITLIMAMAIKRFLCAYSRLDDYEVSSPPNVYETYVKRG